MFYNKYIKFITIYIAYNLYIYISNFNINNIFSIKNDKGYTPVDLTSDFKIIQIFEDFYSYKKKTMNNSLVIFLNIIIYFFK